MKYIRTKENNIVGCDDKNLVACIIAFEPQKIADTIEELCDEFIVVSDNCKKPIISALPFNELQLYAKGKTKYAICYGAIWCEWGLKYVAKINKKGKLELL